jgi:hypothetical protein
MIAAMAPGATSDMAIRKISRCDDLDMRVVNL